MPEADSIRYNAGRRSFNKRKISSLPQDEFIRADRRSSEAQAAKSKKTSLKEKAVRLAAELALAGAIARGADIMLQQLKPQESCVIPVLYGQGGYESIADIASDFDIPEDVILDFNGYTQAYNGFEPDKALLLGDTLKVPAEFDYAGEKAEKIEEEIGRLGNTAGDIMRKRKLEKVLSAVNDKIKDQKSIGFMYTDGSFVYIKTHLKDSDSAYAEHERDESFISAENFKKLFDIADGALIANNNRTKFVNRTLGADGIYDYRNARLKDGETYVIPKEYINAGDINLDDYLGFYTGG